MQIDHLLIEVRNTQQLANQVINFLKTGADSVRLHVLEGQPFTPSFNGTLIVYEEDDKFHAAYFSGDDKPCGPFPGDVEETSKGEYAARRDACSFLSKMRKEGKLRMFLTPYCCEWFGN